MKENNYNIKSSKCMQIASVLTMRYRSYCSL